MDPRRVAELPAAPAGKIGWPWSAEPVAERLGETGPRITVVTPSFNQGPYIEETIRSVLLQGYANLEYIVIDGGSTDTTRAMLQKYERQLHYWVSEADRGQSHALNKGFARGTGAIFAWINSDDVLAPGALAAVARAWREAPGTLIAGPVAWFEDGGTAERVRPQRNLAFAPMVAYWRRAAEFHQPGVFFPAELFRLVGGVDESFRYAMDYDLFCRLLRHTETTYLEQVLARFRYHQSSKTGSDGDLFLLERHRSSRQYWDELGAVDRREVHGFLGSTLTRFGLRRLLAGDLRRAATLLARGAQYAPMAPLTEPWSMLANYVGRRLPTPRQAP